MGVEIDSTRRAEVIELVRKWLVGGRGRADPKFIITAYSESILEAQENPEFKQSLARADLVVPDGVSVAAAVSYIRRFKELVGNKFLGGLSLGLKVGWEILSGRYITETVVGVDLMKDLIKEAGERGLKIMLVGGWNGVALQASKKLEGQIPNLKVVAYEGPIDARNIKSSEENQLVAKINDYRPDLLFVSFGRFRQEVWIASHLDTIKAGVVMGVGSAFDEVARVNGWRDVPVWVRRMGLKWLWRVFQDPKHIKRAWRAFPVFPWKVFLNCLQTDQ